MRQGDGAQASHHATPAVGSDVTRLDTGWPLTGRDSELRAIATGLDDAGGIVLDGAAGVGKTYLARAALARHAADRVRWVIATHSARSIPLGAFRPVLGALPEDAGSALDWAHTALGSPRMLLAVDDAHLLDDASATLLHQLAAERAGRMVITVRTGEPAPDAVTALWKDGLLTRLEVLALSQEHVTTLLELVLGGPLERISAVRLFTATGGNMLWLRHLVDGERASGRLVRGVGVWRWDGEPQLDPALLTDLALANRLVRAARDCGAGFEAQLTLAFSAVLAAPGGGGRTGVRWCCRLSGHRSAAAAGREHPRGQPLSPAEQAGRSAWSA